MISNSCRIPEIGRSELIVGVRHMEIKQIKLRAMEIFCYLIGDEPSKTCALIDPAFETARILKIAKDCGYSVTQVVNTHSHADHIAGNAAIIKATGAKLSIHRLDARGLGKIGNKILVKFLGGRSSPRPDVLLEDQDSVTIGETSLKVLHTPGHSAGGVCLYAQGHVLTGDTLFVGAVGRTDLPGGSHRRLVQSVREKIYTLPEDTKVWPGHDYGPYPSSTVKLEKDTNPYTR